MDLINSLIYSLLGNSGLRFFQNHPLWFLLIGLLVLALAGFLLLSLKRNTVQRWHTLMRDVQLFRFRRGRRLLGLARGIRKSAFRLRGLLGQSRSEQAEGAATLSMIENFIRGDLDDALVQAITFLETGNSRTAEQLEIRLRQQQENHHSESLPRERVYQEMAVTRQRLAQIRMAETQLNRMLETLEDAARSLRALELEWASLGSARTAAISSLKSRLDGMTSDLKNQREAFNALSEQSVEGDHR